MESLQGVIYSDPDGGATKVEARWYGVRWLQCVLLPYSSSLVSVPETVGPAGGKEIVLAFANKYRISPEELKGEIEASRYSGVEFCSPEELGRICWKIHKESVRGRKCGGDREG